MRTFLFHQFFYFIVFLFLNVDAKFTFFDTFSNEFHNFFSVHAHRHKFSFSLHGETWKAFMCILVCISNSLWCGCFQVVFRSKWGKTYHFEPQKRARLDKVHHLSQKHNAWDFVLFATDKLALKSLNELREKYTFFRKNNWEGGKNKTCWHQFLDGASGL